MDLVVIYGCEIENIGGAVSVIFCDTPLRDSYVLNEKFTVN